MQRNHIAHSTPVVDLSISLEMDELFDVFEDKPQAVTPSEAVPKRPKKDKSKKRQVNGDVKKPEDAQTEPDKDTILPDAPATESKPADAEAPAPENDQPDAKRPKLDDEPAPVLADSFELKDKSSLPN